MKFLVVSILLSGLLLGCKSADPKERLPACITLKIEAIKREPIRNPPAEVWQWTSNNTVYYYFNAPCCDQYNYLYTKLCETICAPDGGFTGKGDGHCPDFDKNVKKEVIWKDVRK